MHGGAFTPHAGARLCAGAPPAVGSKLRPMSRKPEGELRRGWTTGACATAAARAAFEAPLTGDFPDSVKRLMARMAKVMTATTYRV